MPILLRSCSYSRALYFRDFPHCDSSFQMEVVRYPNTGDVIAVWLKCLISKALRTYNDKRFFDTCVYYKPGIELLLEVIGLVNVLLGSEMLGAVKGIDLNTGGYFDDTKRCVDEITLTKEERSKIFEGYTRRVFPRLDSRLKSLGM